MYPTRYERRPSLWAGLTRVVEGPAAWLVSLVFFPLLLFVALLLPPVNLLDRLEAFNYTRISAAGGSLKDADGTIVSFPAEGVDASFFAALKTTPRADFVTNGGGESNLENAIKNLPATLTPKSPVYQVRIRGSMPSALDLRIPIPNDSLPYETLSLYAWNGATWDYLPSRVLAGEDVIEANLDIVPASFVVMQTAPNTPVAVLELPQDAPVPPGANTAYEARPGLYLRGDGALEGVAPTINANKTTLPVIRNWQEGQVPRTDLVNNMLIDIGQQDNQVGAVVATVTQNGYPGVIIDYRGVDAVLSSRADFVLLMQRLADELHKAGKTLSVRVDQAQQISPDQWNTGGYDWRGLGRAADTLIIPAPLDPRAFQAGGEMDALLTWAVSQAPRDKIQVEFTGQSIERSGRYFLLKGLKEALQPLVQKVKSESSGSNMAVTLDNPKVIGALTWDAAIGMFTYKYMDDQQLERTVFIENEGSFKHKLALLQKYNVRNVSLEVPPSGDVDPNLWNVVLQFQQGVRLVGEKTALNLTYSAFSADGKQLAQGNASLENPRALLPVTVNANQEVRVDVQVMDGKGAALPGMSWSSMAKSAVGEAVQAVAASAVQVANVAAQSVAAAPDAVQPAAIQAAAVSAQQPASLSSAQQINVRQGPSTNHTLMGQIPASAVYRITGKNQTGDWWQIDVGAAGKGWVFGQLVNPAGNLDAIEVIQDIPGLPIAPAALPVAAAQAAPPSSAPPAEPQPTAAPQAPAQAPPPAAAPVVSAPPPGAGIPFGYGIQAHMVDTSDDMIAQVMGSVQGMGFNWLKQQIEWKRFEDSEGAKDFGPIDPIVSKATASGINLLFSVVNAPAWAREANFDGSVGGPPANPATYASFVGALAGKYCGTSLKAIEVWNEENLHYEWGNKPLNPGEYVALLAQGYAAIKAACPSMYVISGALTPAGNNGSLAMDDFAYLEAMFQAGANNYMDALGAHPSGYNVPPSATAESACAAIQVSGNSFNGACDSPHHSWSFRSTMEGYRAIMNRYGGSSKTVVATEFGWAAGGALHPSYKYADDNDLTEQAQWTVEAYQMAKSWGWAGPMVLWNLNFRVVANGTEKAQWGIVGPSWEPLPVYSALQSMAK